MEKLGFSLFPVAVPTRVTWDRSGGRHLPFSSGDNTAEEDTGWRKQEKHLITGGNRNTCGSSESP